MKDIEDGNDLIGARKNTVNYDKKQIKVKGKIVFKRNTHVDLHVLSLLQKYTKNSFSALSTSVLYSIPATGPCSTVAS